MSRNDIRPSRPGSGGTQHITAYALASGASFVEGEPVLVQASGDVAECGSNPILVTGISAVSSQGKDASGQAGARPTGTLIQVYTTTDEQVFESDNFATDGSGTAATPTLANVGDEANFVLNGADWFLDTGASNTHVEIIEVLDVNGAPLGDTTSRTVGAGVTVRFVFL